MKYAFYPGCVSKGGTPELFDSTIAVAEKLGIELEEIIGAACTGAGVLQEKGLKLGDTLNARTFAMAERMGLTTIMTICSTCQGVMAQANKRLLDDPDYLSEINQELRAEGLEYTGRIVIKHFAWVLVEEIGLEVFKGFVTSPLEGMKVAPFYGCYILRPSDALGLDENPGRSEYLERIIDACAGEAVNFPGRLSCCGFPIMLINEKNSMAMVGKHTHDAKIAGADAMVTPCPLCHLNLDGQQPKASSQLGEKINLPILHLPQLVGMAMGLTPKQLGLQRNVISTKGLLDRASVRV